MKTNTEHLVPMPVRDLGEKIVNKNTHINERNNIADRLTATMNFCEKVLLDSKFIKPNRKK